MNAQSALGAGELVEARRALERALAEDPGILDAHQMLGAVAMREERFAEAVDSFRRALALDAEHEASLFGLANAYRRLGRDDEALVGFERLLALAPAGQQGGGRRRRPPGREGTARRRGRAARAGLAPAADAPPILANQLGELLAGEGRAAEARAAFERSSAANPELAQPQFNLGVLAEEAGDAPAAMRHYERALELAPRHFQAMFNLGRLYGARGDRVRQEELWRAAIAARPDFARGYLLLAKLLMDTGGDLGEAERLAREGLERDTGGATGPLG